MDNNMIVVALKGIIVCRNRILLVKRSDNDESGAGDWEFPGGKINFGEQLEDALKREIFEETGLSVKVADIAYTSTFFTNSKRQVIIICYFCTSDIDYIELSNEHSDYKWVVADKLYDNICDNMKNDILTNEFKIKSFVLS